MYTYHTHAATNWVAWSTLANKKEENSVYNTSHALACSTLLEDSTNGKDKYGSVGGTTFADMHRCWPLPLQLIRCVKQERFFLFVVCDPVGWRSL